MSRRETTQHWLQALERAGVPCGPVNTIDQVFADPQMTHRQMMIRMEYPGSQEGTVPLIGSPLKLSATPVTYRLAPPRLGQDTDDVLEALLGMDAAARATLRRDGVI